MCHLPRHLHISLRHKDTKDIACQGLSCWQTCSLPRCLEQTHELAEYAGVIPCVLCVLCVGVLMRHQELSLGSLALDPLVHHGLGGAQVLLPGLVNTYKEFRRGQSSHPASMDLQGRSMWPDKPDEHGYLPYHLKGLEVDELTELIEGCGFLSDAGGSVNISFIADSMHRRILIPASDQERGLRDIRLTFTASCQPLPNLWCDMLQPEPVA